MSLATLLTDHEKDVLAHWVDRIRATYPLGTAGFLRTVENRFANPVGHATEHAAKLAFAAACGKDVPEADLSSALEELMRIRAVQDFSPEEAAGVFFLLKHSIREKLGKELQKQNLYPELLEVEGRIDSLTLMAFGLYARFREQIYTQRLEDFRRANAMAAKMAARSGT